MHDEEFKARAKTDGKSPHTKPHPSRSLEAYLGMKVVVLKRTDTLRQASMAMAENNIGCVLVANNDGKITGILTDRDLALTVSVVQKGVDAPIYECMAEPLCSVPPEAGVLDVIAEMVRHKIRRMPVITGTHHSGAKCLGIVTLDDLVATQAIGIDEACGIIRSQIQKPARRQHSQHH